MECWNSVVCKFYNRVNQTIGYEQTERFYRVSNRTCSISWTWLVLQNVSFWKPARTALIILSNCFPLYLKFFWRIWILKLRTFLNRQGSQLSKFKTFSRSENICLHAGVGLSMAAATLGVLPSSSISISSSGLSHCLKCSHQQNQHRPHSQKHYQNNHFHHCASYHRTSAKVFLSHFYLQILIFSSVALLTCKNKLNQISEIHKELN